LETWDGSTFSPYSGTNARLDGALDLLISTSIPLTTTSVWIKGVSMSGASFARVEVQFSVCGFEILTTTPTPILLLGHNRSQGEVRYPSSTYISLITNSEPGCPVT